MISQLNNWWIMAKLNAKKGKNILASVLKKAAKGAGVTAKRAKLAMTLKGCKKK